jgi:hypothetical protein
MSACQQLSIGMMRLPAEKLRGVTAVATGARAKLAAEMKTATATAVLCFK